MFMKDDQPPLFNALRTHLGGDIAAALPILLNGLPASSIDELVSLAERLEQKRAWSLVFPTWFELIADFRPWSALSENHTSGMTSGWGFFMLETDGLRSALRRLFP